MPKTAPTALPVTPVEDRHWDDMQPLLMGASCKYTSCWHEEHNSIVRNTTLEWRVETTKEMNPHTTTLHNDRKLTMCDLTVTNSNTTHITILKTTADGRDGGKRKERSRRTKRGLTNEDPMDFDL